MNYKDVAITGQQLADLKKPAKRTGWRLKIKKPRGAALPDPADTQLLKIDQAGDDSLYPMDTGSGAYRKVIHDKKTNRTFILHNILVSQVKTVVSIINHDLDPEDEGFIESISTQTFHDTPDWNPNFSIPLYNMGYDHDKQRLAVATLASGERMVAGLYVIDVNKYIDEISPGGCGSLKPNPDYLKSEHWVAGDEPDRIVSLHGGGVRYVEYYNGKFYTWTECVTNYPGENHYYQLGYYTDSKTYKILLQYGRIPDYIKYTGYEYNKFDPSVIFPNQAMWGGISDDYSSIIGTDNLYFGDPAVPFMNVTSFKINSDGILTMGCSNYGGISIECGMEPLIAVFDLNKEDEESLSETHSFGFEPYYNELYDRWIIASTTRTWETSGSSFPGKGMVRVKIVCTDPTLSLTSSYGYAQNRYGTVRFRGNKTGAGNLPYTWHTDIFCYNESLKMGFEIQAMSEEDYFSVTFVATVTAYPSTLIDMIGLHTEGAKIVQASDSERPETGVWESAGGAQWNVAHRNVNSNDKHTAIVDAMYDSEIKKYFLGIADQDGKGLGLWVMDASGEARTLAKYTPENSDLKYPRVAHLFAINSSYIGVVSDNYKEAGFVFGAGDIAMQIFNTNTGKFSEKMYEASPLGYLNTIVAKEAVYDEERGIVGLCAGDLGSGIESEMWIWRPDTAAKDPRNLRKWWDGEAPDYILGENGGVNEFGQISSFFSPSWSQSKGGSSASFDFITHGADYLPWTESMLNEEREFPGVYNGLLMDGSRIVIERGIWNGRDWDWIQEGQTIITELEVDADGGDVEMKVNTQGVSAMILTRSTYTGSHRPETESFEDVSLISDDGGYTYFYEVAGGIIGDWGSRPQPKVKIDGQIATDYDLDIGGGYVSFDEPQQNVQATFSRYVPGSNEAEDIILCILSYPEELGGCGLDESWFTREIAGETLTTNDNRTYSFSRNNIRPDAIQNAVYVNGTPATGLSWDFKRGTATFASPQTGTVTGDCLHYTIQTTGITLEPISFSPAKNKSSYDCIEEIMKRVSPNYILREGRDGKLEAGCFTQKAAGEEDIVIYDNDIILNMLGSETAYTSLATRVLSLGKASLEDLPNLCYGMPVTDHWFDVGWHAGVDLQWITDGDPATGATAGWGGKEGYMPALQAISAFGEEGKPCVSIDMGKVYEVGTIIIARPSQRSNEGATNPDEVQTMSIDASVDGADWTKIVEKFKLLPGNNQKFVAGTNFDEGTSFRYIRVNIHMIGLYVWEHTDSQMGISEIQCYPPDIIVGEARLQSEDSTKPLYDRWGLLDRYGVITHIARGGAADPALYTREKADLDAKFTLEEIVRLMDTVSFSSPWLPGIPVFSTVRVENSALGIQKTFFVENHAANENGDSYGGRTLP